jgi:hypothetical protein
MRVLNMTDHGVFIPNYGVVGAHAEATVRESAAVRQLLANGTLTEVTAPSGTTASKNAKKDEEADG